MSVRLTALVPGVIGVARYTLDTLNKIAHQQELSAPATRPVIAAANGARGFAGGGSGSTAVMPARSVVPAPNPGGQTAAVRK